MKFNAEAMKHLVDKDGYLSFVFRDLARRNPNLTDAELLEIIYNSNVIEDSVYSSLYIKEFIIFKNRGVEE